MDQKISDLLNQLNKETGLHFEMAVEDVDDDTSLRLQELLLSVKDHTRRDLFWHNLLLGQLTREEVNVLMHRFHIDVSARWVLFLVAFMSDMDEMAESVLRTYVKNHDELVQMDGRHMAVLHRVASDDDPGDIAGNISDMLSGEAMVMTKIAYDSPVSDILDLKTSLKHSEAALKIAELLYNDKSVISYDDLSFEKLLYSVPAEAAEEFLSQKAGNLDISRLDNEMRTTITTLFKNELNLADTAKELFIHRNTLVYRLDKFEKLTGLDIRRFDDAVVCRVALILGGFLS